MTSDILTATFDLGMYSTGSPSKVTELIIRNRIA